MRQHLYIKIPYIVRTIFACWYNHIVIARGNQYCDLFLFQTFVHNQHIQCVPHVMYQIFSRTPHISYMYIQYGNHQPSSSKFLFADGYFLSWLQTVWQLSRCSWQICRRNLANASLTISLTSLQSPWAIALGRYRGKIFRETITHPVLMSLYGMHVILMVL